jgi:hypothetical protein
MNTDCVFSSKERMKSEKKFRNFFIRNIKNVG